MQRIIKYSSIIFTIVLVLIALAIAFISFPIFGNRVLIVRSGSMTPAVNSGSVIIVRSNSTPKSDLPLKPKYEKGDIIAFRSEKNENIIITHRINSYQIFNNTVFYKTKGDTNEEADNWQVDEKNIIGKSFLIIPEVGRILTFAKSGYGLLTIIIIPALSVTLLEIKNIIKELKKSRNILQPQIDSRYERNKKTITKSVLTETNSSANRYKPFFINYKTLTLVISFIASGIILPTTLAYYHDTETSSENRFQAADIFPSAILEDPNLTPTTQQNPTGFGLVINEVSPLGTAAAEWVELFNPTGSPIDVSGWTIADASSSDIIPPVSPIPTGGYAVIITNTSIVNNIPESALIIRLTNSQIGGGLNNTGGDQVVLRNLAENLIDQMSYGSNANAFSSPPAIPSNVTTLSRSPNGIDTNLSNDWITNSAGTLGISN